MIYQRRALQRRLNELRDELGDNVIDKLADRLNRAGKDRLAAMWELVVLHGLSKCGHVQSEVVLASLRQPDILFEQGPLRLTADVTTVSDEGLDNANPYEELGKMIEVAKCKLRLPIGGLDLQVLSKRTKTPRGSHTVLRLPPRKNLQEFVDSTITPQLRAQIAEGSFPLRISIDDGDVGLDITIDPTRSPISSGGFESYDLPQIKDRNPLYNALKAKAAQLQGAEGIRGVIVGDGDSVSLTRLKRGSYEVSTRQIVDEFFRQFSSIDFVLILSVREHRQGWVKTPGRQNEVTLIVRESCAAAPELEALFEKMVVSFPMPAMMPVNGARRAREQGYFLGHHGGYSMSTAPRKVRLGLREFTEIFAGLRTLQDGGAINVTAARANPPEHNFLRGFVLKNLEEGRLPQSIEIIKGTEDESDDWVEIYFDEVDPAIAPLR